MENGLIGFQKKSNNYFMTSLGRARLEDAEVWEVKWFCNGKVYQT